MKKLNIKAGAEKEIADKIDELISVVNELEKKIDFIMENVAPNVMINEPVTGILGAELKLTSLKDIYEK